MLPPGVDCAGAFKGKNLVASRVVRHWHSEMLLGDVELVF